MFSREDKRPRPRRLGVEALTWLRKRETNNKIPARALRTEPRPPVLRFSEVGC